MSIHLFDFNLATTWWIPSVPGNTPSTRTTTLNPPICDVFKFPWIGPGARAYRRLCVAKRNRVKFTEGAGMGMQQKIPERLGAVTMTNEKCKPDISLVTYGIWWFPSVPITQLPSTVLPLSWCRVDHQDLTCGYYGELVTMLHREGNCWILNSSRDVFSTQSSMTKHVALVMSLYRRPLQSTGTWYSYKWDTGTGLVSPQAGYLRVKVWNSCRWGWLTSHVLIDLDPASQTA